MRNRIIVPPVLQKLKELLGPPLLEQPHQAASHGLHLGRGHLGDAPVPVDEGSCDLLELEVSEDVGVDEDLCELSRCEDELGDEVDGP